MPARAGVSTVYWGAGIVPGGWLTVLVIREAMTVRLFAGDDWAEDHHDIEVMTDVPDRHPDPEEATEPIQIQNARSAVMPRAGP